MVDICWGKGTAYVGGGEYAEGYSEFNLPVTYLDAPTAVVSIHDIGGAVGEYAVVGMVSTSKLGVWCGHVRSASAGNVEFEWLTIGV